MSRNETCRFLVSKGKNCPFRHANCEPYGTIPSILEEEKS
jgi:hypothetical protein